jgi:mannosyltransferase
MLCQMRAYSGSRATRSLAGVVVLAAALRFYDLGARGFWRDEAVTVELVRKGFGSMLGALPGSEGTPPLYYVLLWGWSRIFGSNEVGLRSFSAVVGTATVPIIYRIAAELLSRRAALVAAVLAAVSPLLVWHSQDARSYALLVFFSAFSLLFFVRSLRAPTVRTLALWTLASGLALGTHYFALFAVAPEALWLLLSAGRSAHVLSAIAAVGAVGAALTPLALAQRSNVGWIAEVPRGHRIYEVAEEFLVGPQAPRAMLVAGGAGILVLIGLALLAWYGGERERRAAAVAGGIGGAALLIPLVLSVSGLDYVLARNLIAAWTAIAIVLAAGLAAPRAGPIGLPAVGLLVALGIAVNVATADEPKFRAEDWRGAARAIGPADSERADVIVPDTGLKPLLVYRAAARPFPARGARVREVVVVALGPANRELGRGGRYPLPPKGLFREVERRQGRYFTLVRFHSSEPRFVTPGVLGIGRHKLRSAVALLDGPPTGDGKQ